MEAEACARLTTRAGTKRVNVTSFASMTGHDAHVSAENEGVGEGGAVAAGEGKMEMAAPSKALRRVEGIPLIW